jgi:hypothetical protein
MTLMFTGPPRPSADNLKEGKLAVVLHSDVTLQFLAQNYFDEENNTIFTWYNQNSSLQNGGRKYIISSLGLQSTLIVRNVTQTDYGQYHVEVRNSAGFYIHYYELTKGKHLYIKILSFMIIYILYIFYRIIFLLKEDVLS